MKGNLLTHAWALLEDFQLTARHGPGKVLATGTAAELRPALLAALGTLTSQQRTIVVLRYFDDLSENEVAELLGVSPGTVKSTASRAVAQLRTQPGLIALFAAADITI